MNILEFEVHNQVLTRVDSQDVVSKSHNIYKCRFTFEEDSEWFDKNKFAIFTDGWGNSTTQHLGKNGEILTCLVPEKMLKGSYFKISVYAGDLVTTNNVSVALIKSGYTRRKRTSCPDEGKDIFVEIFDRLDNNVDSIIYNDHSLHLFNRDEIVESIYLPFVEENELRELVQNLVNEFILDKVPLADNETDGLLSHEDKTKLDSIEIGANKTIVDNEINSMSENPISNSAVAEALNTKEDTYDVVERIDKIIIDLINIGD